MPQSASGNTTNKTRASCTQPFVSFLLPHTYEDLIIPPFHPALAVAREWSSQKARVKAGTA